MAPCGTFEGRCMEQVFLRVVALVVVATKAVSHRSSTPSRHTR
jgi:hypothetical protein